MRAANYRVCAGLLLSALVWLATSHLRTLLRKRQAKNQDGPESANGDGAYPFTGAQGPWLLSAAGRRAKRQG